MESKNTKLIAGGILVAAALIAAYIISGKSSSSASSSSLSPSSSSSYELNDCHFHLTNYIQKGTDIHKFVEIMGTRVGRCALFGIPLQQLWDKSNSGDFAPTYYLASDEPLYYYSFTDAYIAMAYKSLSPEDQKRFDPMITGFNPADMYAADHIRRCLKTFPGVFTGVGEFTIHKEFVSSKVAGPTASLVNPALDSIFTFCGEVGLVVLLHNDIDVPFPKEGQENWQVKQLRALFERHKETSIIWAHCGLGRIVHPAKDQMAMIDRALSDPKLSHVNIDLSWTEVAKYLVATPEAIETTAELITRHPTRFLMGTDEVAPNDQASYLKILDMYKPLLDKLSPEVKDQLMKKNYERIFDEARVKVRAWEAEHANETEDTPPPSPSSGAHQH